MEIIRLISWIALCCCSCCFVAKSCLTLLQPRGLQLARLLCPWVSKGKNSGVGCHALLQGIFPTQGSNPGLLHCREILYHLGNQRRPNQSILKEINPEYPLEGLILKLKLQYFGYLMRTDSFEKTLMLAKMEGRRRRGQHRMRWLDGITGWHRLNGHEFE